MANENLLFPSDAAPTTAPNWYVARTAEAERRLMGRHDRPAVQANVLFPTEERAAPAPIAKPGKAPEDVASALFRTERAPDLYDQAVKAVIEPLAESARIDGDADRAEQWRDAATTLTDDFRASGMDADEVQQVMELAREGLGNTLPGMPVDEERLSRMNEQGEAWMIERGVTDAEIDAARAMINDLELRTPGLKDYLADTGLGSDPRLIEKAIREAKRRGYR